MENFFKLITSQLVGFFKGLDEPSRRKMIIAAALMIAAIGTISWFISKPDLVVLYSGLDSKESGEIYQKLVEMKVVVKPESNGTIKVEKSREAEIKMKLASEGYPKSGFTNDYFTNGTGLGATDFDKRYAARLALQDRLQTAIKTMEGVKNAIVTISEPDQDSFVLKSDKKETMASVLLTLGNESLSKKQVKGIEELVAKSVIGLKPENISIVDSDMNALNLHDSSGAGTVNSQFEMEEQLKESLQRQIVTLLEPVFGKSKVIPSVYVKLNFDKKITNSVQFNPVSDDTGITVSINELKESVSSGSSSSIDETGQTQYASDQGAGQGDYTKSNKTVNYEVNQVKEQIESAQGKLEKLTLSVLIDKSDLDEQTINTVQKLVQTSMGIDNSANVVVKGMSFDGVTAEKNKESNALKSSNKDAFLKNAADYGIKAILILMGFFVLFMLYKFIMKIKISVNETKPYDTIKKAKFIDEIVEMPEEDKEQMAKKRRIDNLVDSKPDVVAQQIKDWLNES